MMIFSMKTIFSIFIILITLILSNSCTQTKFVLNESAKRVPHWIYRLVNVEASVIYSRGQVDYFSNGELKTIKINTKIKDGFLNTEKNGLLILSIGKLNRLILAPNSLIQIKSTAKKTRFIVKILKGSVYLSHAPKDIIEERNLIKGFAIGTERGGEYLHSYGDVVCNVDKKNIYFYSLSGVGAYSNLFIAQMIPSKKQFLISKKVNSKELKIKNIIPKPIFQLYESIISVTKRPVFSDSKFRHLQNEFFSSKNIHYKEKINRLIYEYKTNFLKKKKPLTSLASYNVFFKSVPLSEVYINGKLKGKTPLKLTLKKGTYKASFKETKSKQVIKKKIVIKGLEKNISIATIFKQKKPLTSLASYNVSFKSVPLSEVYINGKLKGKTPLKLTLKKGTYKASFKETKSKQVIKKKIVIKGLEKNISIATTFTNIPASLILNIKDKEALINLFDTKKNVIFQKEDFKKEKANLYFINLEPGNYKLTATKKGFQQKNWSLQIEPSQKHNLTIVLDQGTIEKKTPIKIKTKKALGIDASKAGIFLCDGQNKEVLWIDFKGNEIQKLNYPVSGDHFFLPTDVSYDKQNLIISDSRKNQAVLFQINKQNKFLITAKIFSNMFIPIGVDNKYKIQAIANSAKNQIVFIKDGETKAIDKLNLSEPNDIAILNDKVLLISDWGNLRLIKATFNGEMIQKTKINFIPGPIEVSQKYYVFSVNRKENSIYFYDINFKKQKLKIVVPKEKKIYDISYFDSKIYVSLNGFNEILVYKLNFTN